MNHGLSANLVHKWKREAAVDRDAVFVSTFVPVDIVPDAVRAVKTRQFIEVNLQRGPVAVPVRWPVAAAKGLCGGQRTAAASSTLRL